MRTLYPYKISKMNLFLQDEALDLDELTELTDNTVFELEQLPSQSQEGDLEV